MPLLDILIVSMADDVRSVRLGSRWQRGVQRPDTVGIICFPVGSKGPSRSCWGLETKTIALGALLTPRGRGAARFAYNRGLVRCREAIERGQRIPSAMDLHKVWNVWKRQHAPWWVEVSKVASQEAFRDLERAIRNGREGRAGRRILFLGSSCRSVHEHEACNTYSLAQRLSVSLRSSALCDAQRARGPAHPSLVLVPSEFFTATS